MKAVFIDYTGTLLKYENSDLDEFYKRFSASTNFKTIEEAKQWWETTLRSLEKEKVGEAFIKEDDLIEEALKLAQQSHRLKEEIQPLHQLHQNYWMYGEFFRDAVTFLSNNTLPVYIITNVGKEYVRINLHRQNFHVNDVFSSEDAKCYKPDTGIFEYALEKTGFKPEEVLVVGDGEVDILGAMQLNMPCVLVDRKGIYRKSEYRRVRNVDDIRMLVEQ